MSILGSLKRGITLMPPEFKSKWKELERTLCKIMNSFERLDPQYARAIRDGTKNTILADELVVGNLVEVGAGDRVPADIRVIFAHQLEVDNSSGESEPESRGTEYVNENPIEAFNLDFFSTDCIDELSLAREIALLCRIAGFGVRQWL